MQAHAEVLAAAPVYLFHAAQHRLLSYYDMLRVRAVCRALRPSAEDCLPQAASHLSFPRAHLWLLSRARRRDVVVAAVAWAADKLRALDLSALGPMSSNEFGMLFDGLRLHVLPALDDLTLPPVSDWVQAAAFMAGMTSLTRLDYSRSAMHASGTFFLQNTIQRLRGTRSLDAREVAGPAFPALVSSLSSLASLHELVMRDSDFLAIGGGGAGLVKFLTGLRTLDLSGGTNLNPDEVNSRAFGRSLGGMTALTTLCLSNSRPKSPENALANSFLWVGFAQCNVTGHAPLRRLAIRGNGCDAETCVSLSSVIDGLPLLEDLDLSDNEIDARGVQALAGVFLNGPVKILNLSENSLGPEGAVLLASAFESMTRLEQLDLTDNGLGEGTLELVSRGLPASMRALRLGSNGIDDQGLSAIGRTLDALPALECLELPNNDVSDAGLVNLANLLETGRDLRLKTLDLGGNGFGDEGCSALAGERRSARWCGVLLFDRGLTRVSTDFQGL